MLPIPHLPRLRWVGTEAGENAPARPWIQGASLASRRSCSRATLPGMLNALEKLPRWRAVAALIAAILGLALGACPTRGAAPPERSATRTRVTQDVQDLVARRIAARRARPPAPHDKPREALAFYLEKRVPPGESLDVTRYRAAMAHSARMTRYASGTGARLEPAAQAPGRSGPVWEALGPGNVGGRTRALAIRLDLPSTLYAGSVGGGIWKSTDAGDSWRALDDFLPNLAVSSLLIDRADPTRLYAGTGEGYYNADAIRGAGIFASTDAGASWQRLEATATTAFQYVNRLAQSPNDPSTLYAATRAGLQRSTDRGVSWTNALENPSARVAGPASAARDAAAATSAGLLEVIVHPTRSPDLVLATSGSFVSDGVYRSTDGGESWTRVLDSTSAGVAVGRTVLAYAPSVPDTIYAAVADTDGAAAGLFRSTDAGASWTLRHGGAAAGLNWLDNVCFSGSNQGWYDLALAVDPVNANRLWLGGIDLFRSDDGGATIRHASYWYLIEVLFNSYAHADQHLIVFHPGYDGAANTTVYFANDGGLFRSGNALAATDSTFDCNIFGLADVEYTNLNNGYGATQFYHGVPFPDGRTYFGGTQDNGTVLGTDADGADDWRRVHSGDGGYVAVDATNTDVLYAETTDISIVKSTNGGSSFKPATTGISDTGLFINPFTMSPNNSQILWTGGYKPWRTTNAGAQWEQAGTFPGGGRVTALAVAPGNDAIAAMATSSGIVYRSANAMDAAPAWSDVSAGLPGSRISWITIDPNDADVMYVTHSRFGAGHVYRTTNGGGEWAVIDGSGDTALPDVPAHTLAVHPEIPDQLYVGTDLGVYVTLDGGTSWMVENTGFANVVTESLAVQQSGGRVRLFAFTHGRGAFRTDISVTPTATVTATPTRTPVASATPTATMTVPSTAIATASPALPGTATATPTATATGSAPGAVPIGTGRDATLHAIIIGIALSALRVRRARRARRGAPATVFLR
ncbi:MAG: hypothetical protein HYV63_02605 [Candidatus Schekmanbacteria bacterium]|nr:hypothetical protein [Candidatus Schekmanbacteria bacterium]